MRTRWCGVVLVAALLPACNSSTTTPSTTSTDTSTPTTTATLSAFVVAGEPALTGVRQRSQYMATVAYSDDTSKDVTKVATWLSSDSAVATVTSAGVVTTIKAGTTRITAAYDTGQGAIDVTVAPIVTTVQGTVAGSDGQKGTFTLNLQGAITQTALPTTAPVAGTLRLGAATSSLSGFYAAATGAVTVVSPEIPLNFSGVVANNTLSGTYSGPNDLTGTFTSTSVTVGR